MQNLWFQNVYLSVGIDVGADFSWMSIALPNQTFHGKPFKIIHSAIDSLLLAVSKIKEAESYILWKVAFSLNPRASIITHSSAIFVIRALMYRQEAGWFRKEPGTERLLSAQVPVQAQKRRAGHLTSRRRVY
ncbi:MAG TPA: hypothetical protein VN381_03920 [Anaerovoracaceae bacterium]|nr:hypothetical protein [Anaerovoracaceae bacterium]